MAGKSLRIGLGIMLLVLVPVFNAQTRTPIAAPSSAPVKTPAPQPQVVPQSTDVQDPQFGQRRNQEDPVEVRMERERQKAMNKERFENLKKDTDKLLKLATELKENVDKSTKDTLSLEVIRKTNEIEKLAKQVREKMKAL